MTETLIMPNEVQDQDALFERLLKDALAIQDRFAKEPTLKTFGKGQMTSAGIEGLKADAEELAVRFQRPCGIESREE